MYSVEPAHTHQFVNGRQDKLSIRKITNMYKQNSTLAKHQRFPTRIRTLAARVRGGYHNQLDYRGLMWRKVTVSKLYIKTSKLNVRWRLGVMAGVNGTFFLLDSLSLLMMSYHEHVFL